MNLDKAVDIILKAVRAPGGQPRTPDQAQDIADAADILEDFFIHTDTFCDGEYDIGGEG